MPTRRFYCKACGSFDGYRSRCKGLSENIFLPLLLLRPVRCGGCYRRSYKSVFIKLWKRDEFQMVTEVMAARISTLQSSPSEPYTGYDSSGHGPASVVRTEEVRLQQ
jgi:hypothetical protein